MRRVIFLILSLLPLFSNAQFDIDNEPNLVKVQGEFITKQRPENLIVKLEITETDMEYSKCFDKAFDTLKKLKEAFINNGIEEESIKTRDLSVREEYSWENSKKSRKGYKAFINMEIERKYSEEFGNKLLQSLREYSFDVNYNIKFVLSEEQKVKLRELAIQEAIGDAFSKAQLIAKSSNIKLGNIYKISYGESWNFGIGRMDNDLVFEDAIEMPAITGQSFGNTGIDFNPKEIAIKKTILVEWKIKE